MKAQEWKSFISKTIEDIYKYYEFSVREYSYKVNVKAVNMLEVLIDYKTPFVVALRIKEECEKCGCKVSLWYPNNGFFEIKVEIPE